MGPIKCMYKKIKVFLFVIVTEIGKILIDFVCLFIEC